MTYFPIKPVSTAPASTLADADQISVLQSGVSHNVMLSVLKSYLLAGATGSTGASPTGSTAGSTGATGGTTGSTGGGSTGTTGGSTGGVAPAGRLGYPAVTTAVPNTATTPAAVTVPVAPSRSLPPYTAYNSTESPNGKVLDSSNYASDSITYQDGTKLTLISSPVNAGTYRVQINGGALAGRVDLENFNSTNIDGVVLAVYYYHRTYIKTNYGHPGGDTWLVIEGEQAPLTDCDTEADDPRVTFLVADAMAPVGDPPYGLGAHPGSIGDEPRFGTYLAQFTKEVGNVSYINAFADGSDFSSWGNNAYAAAQDLYNVSPNKNIIPVYGLPMARGGQGINDFNAFANGTYDQDIKDGVKGYLNFFDEVHVRPGYEMNGTFMNWFWGGQNGDTTTGPAWVAAFKRIYTMAHQAATEASSSSGRTKTVLVTWNPCHQNYNSGYNPKDMYPGNAYVDYHGLDVYSPQYTQDESNWKDGGFYPKNPSNPDDKVYWQIPQALEPVNRIHFWDYPAAKFGIGGGNETGGTNGWGMQDAIAFAKACGKPLAFPECGAGQNFSDRGIGPAEDDVFPYYLRSRCDQAGNLGVQILYANIWSGDEKDGGWGFLYRQRPKTAIAWGSGFGGTGAALKYLGASSSTGSTSGSTGSTSGSAGSTGPVTNQNGGTLPTSGNGTPSASGSTLASTTGSLVDAAGITWTLYAITGGFRPVLGGVGDARTDSNPTLSLLYYNGLMYAYRADKIWYYFSFGNYTANPGDPRPATTTATGPATATVTDTSGNTATFTLNGYQNFYNTGLTCNIYYYADGNGNPTLSSSAPGTVASVVITENGNNVMVSADLASVTTYNTGATGSTGSTGAAGSGPASLVVNGTNGVSQTFSLAATPPNGSQTFYNSDTGLGANVSYFVGNDGNLYVNDSADGAIASATLTLNGLAITSLLPNTTVN